MSEFFSVFFCVLSFYYIEMSIMFMVIILVVYGDLINGYVKCILVFYYFIICVSLFVVLCVFGYGVLILYGVFFLKYILVYLFWQY